jgi:chromosome partitioning protein
MRSIAFHIQKGGTGKTSCAGNVASGLARQGHKTVLIDCDQQENASSWRLLPYPQAPFDGNLMFFDHDPKSKNDPRP